MSNLSAHISHYLYSPDAWITFLTLSLLEIVLGIDNVVFLAIVANRLDIHQRAAARFVGLLLALFMRVAFLVSVVWLVGLTNPLFGVAQFFPDLKPDWIRELTFSWRELILLAGGVFLVYKAITEVGAEILPGEHQRTINGASAFGFVVLQIVALDLVFSIDSVMTAVGLSRDLPIMIAAITVAILVMLIASGAVGRFIERHPTVKMLALAFLTVVGAALIADGLRHHVPRQILYVLIGFSVLVEIFKLLAGRRAQDLAERLDNPVVRLLGILLLAASGVWVYANLNELAHGTFVATLVAVFVFQIVLELLNGLARAKRRRTDPEAA